MCGIAGIRRFDGAPVGHHTIQAMISQLHHRGPDANGVWIDGSIGLGHARLSIIDPTGSPQPMASVDGRSRVTFNGEILNYRQLRSELDYPFTTAGDTEVLLAMHQLVGPDSATRLRGQFAFALYDSDSDVLHLTRDRLGILPLYYYSDRNLFAFASEPKALLAVLPHLEIDQESLHDYLTHRAVPAPYTLLDKLRKLPAGHRLDVDAEGRLRLKAYWEPTRVSIPVTNDPSTAVRLVAESLEQAVEEAQVADVPVGTYLSGGVDSSLITALVARNRAGGEALHTYAAGFGDPRMDELPWARRVSALLGTQHHEVMVSATDFADSWESLTWHRDAPLSEPADVAVHRIARRASEDVKVVLSGEGSDELFGGYPKYRFAQATRWAGLVPKGLRRSALDGVRRALPARANRLDTALRALSGSTSAERMRTWFAPFTEAERSALLGGPPLRNSLGPYERASGSALHRMLVADLHCWLSDNLLERGDRMTMAASIELRPPFLDNRLVELALSLPDDVKVRKGVTKWVVKQVARRYLPDEVVDRPKIGFKVPLDAWFRDGLREMTGDLLLSRSSFVGQIFDRAVVNRFVTDHDAGVRNHQAQLWPLMALEVWHRQLTSVRAGTAAAVRNHSPEPTITP